MHTKIFWKIVCICKPFYLWGNNVFNYVACSVFSFLLLFLYKGFWINVDSPRAIKITLLGKIIQNSAWGHKHKKSTDLSPPNSNWTQSVRTERTRSDLIEGQDLITSYFGKNVDYSNLNNMSIYSWTRSTLASVCIISLI